MSIYDDMFDLDDHFSNLIESDGSKEAKRFQEAWGRISKSHADLERYQMKTEDAMQGFSAILRVFKVKRE